MDQLDKAGLGEIEQVQELEPVYQNPVLIVKAGKPGPIWPPSSDAESSLRVGKESLDMVSYENEKTNNASVYLHHPVHSLP